MMYIEVFSTSNCSLCDEAKDVLSRLNVDYGIEVREVLLTQDHPDFSKYKNIFPVIRASNGKSVSGKVTDKQLRDLLVSLTPPPRIYYLAKFLQALAIVAVFFGFMYGLLGDMWTDLYFFIGGIAVFLIGRILEKKEKRSREKVEATE
jgi:glutaredoxin